MSIINATIIKKDKLRLGASSRNIHLFDRVNAVKMPLPFEPRLVRKTSIVKKYKDLEKECKSYILPPVFAYGMTDSPEHIEAISSGNRGIFLPQDKYVLDLKDLGLSKTSLKQEFVVDVKGCGTRLGNSRRISKTAFGKFLRRHKIKGLAKNLENELIFSRNRYLDFETPEGAQDFTQEDYSLDAFETFLDIGFKLAPMIGMFTYPKKVQEFAKEFDSDDFLKEKLVQEKRLMPSFVRASYLEHNRHRNSEIVRMISEDQKVLRSLGDVFVDDMLVYFENLSVNTEKEEEDVHNWCYVGDIARIFKEPERILKREYGWYLVKDLVLAGSGMYFVDHDGCYMEKKARTKEGLKSQQGLYISMLFKDFFRMLTLYNIAVEDEKDPEKQKKIECDSREKIIERLNRSPFIKIAPDKGYIELKLKYEGISPITYRINKEYLHEVVL